MNKKIKIVYAEDKQLFRKMILESLNETAPDIECVGEASNGKELLRLLNSTRVDVILLDLDMPLMDGNSALTEILQTYPAAKILIISFHYESELVDDYLRRGAKGYICKDNVCGKIEILKEAIEKINNGNLFVCETPPLNKNIFTRRQTEIIPLLCDNLTNKEIANRLGIHERGVERHLQKIYKKTNSNRAASFLKYAYKKGLDFLERKHQA